MAATPEDLLAFLETLGIQAKTHQHAPLFTVEESRALRGTIPGLHSKNLFVRDRKKRYFLITVEEEAQVDLKLLHHAIGAQGKVSFGSAEALFELWGVKPGSVTPFGAINDPTSASPWSSSASLQKRPWSISTHSTIAAQRRCLAPS